MIVSKNYIYISLYILKFIWSYSYYIYYMYYIVKYTGKTIRFFRKQFYTEIDEKSYTDWVLLE